MTEISTLIGAVTYIDKDKSTKFVTFPTETQRKKSKLSLKLSRMTNNLTDKHKCMKIYSRIYLGFVLQI